jgi:hypothetical protein
VRISVVLLPLWIIAVPAFAQPVAPAEPAQPKLIQLSPETADRLTGSVQALSKALLDMKVGGVQAALEGREPTRAERNLTVRDLARRSGPTFDRDIQQQINEAEPRVERSIKALNQTLPKITQDLQRAQKSIERAMANMPDPNYPKR